MAETTLGIEIHRDKLIAVMVLHRLRARELLLCEEIPFGDGGFSQALAELSSSLKERPDTVAVSVPPSDCSFRILSLPFKDKKALAKTLGFELEPLVPFSLEDKIYDFAYFPVEAGSQLLVSIIPKERLSFYIDTLKSHRLDPEIIDVNLVPLARFIKNRLSQDGPFGVLQISEGYVTILLMEGGGIGTIREINFGRKVKEDSGDRQIRELIKEIDLTLQSYRLSTSRPLELNRVFIVNNAPQDGLLTYTLEQQLGMPVEEYLWYKNMEFINPVGEQVRHYASALALALGEYHEGLGFNFRKDEFAKQRHFAPIIKNLKGTMFFVILLVLLLGVIQIMEIKALEEKKVLLERQIHSLYTQELKVQQKVKNPLAEAKKTLKELNATYKDLQANPLESKVMEVLTEIFKRVGADTRVELSRIVMDTEYIQLTGEADSFNSIDVMKSELQTVKIFKDVSIQSANVDKNTKIVKFEMKIKR